MTKHDNDPDETEGRKLYRAKADTLASAQVSVAKRTVKVRDDKCPGCGAKLRSKWSGVECTKCAYWFCF